MRLTKVLLVCNELPLYYKYAKDVYDLWEQRIKIQPHLFIISDNKLDIDFGNRIVQYIKPIPDIPSSFQSQVIRLLLPCLYKDDYVIITDIDMLPIQKKMFRKVIKYLNDDMFEKYEILIVGDLRFSRKNCRTIFFNPASLAKKKNKVCQSAKFENLVIMHDYVILQDGWYEGFKKFGTNWDICMNKIETIEGERTIDWMGLPSCKKYGNVNLPYDYKDTKNMYISGTYFVVKKKILKKYPLNEKFKMFEAEDIEWSKRLLGGFYDSEWLLNMCKMDKVVENEKPCIYKMNVESSVKFIKEKVFWRGFFKKYDMHSGDNSRPRNYKKEDYEYLLKREEMGKEAYLNLRKELGVK